MFPIVFVAVVVERLDKCVDVLLFVANQHEIVHKEADDHVFGDAEARVELAALEPTCA